MSRRSRTGALALVGALIVLSILPAASEAARRKVPFGFFGASFDPPSAALPDATLDGQARLMARSGVESIRVVFSWDSAQPISGPPRWAGLDRTVRIATRHGLDILPIVIRTPRWASSNPLPGNYFLYAPRDPNTYGSFLQALIGRYGPRGSFWTENPGLPKRPLRDWQIWNEPSATYFWATPNYRRTYPRLLKVAYQAVKRVDRGARVVMAGLASFLQRTGKKSQSWQDHRAFYRSTRRLRRYYDVAAIHPFSSSLTRVIKIVRAHRKVMRRYGDSRKRIYLTELSWPAPNGRIPRSALLGFEVSARRQRKLLGAAYRRLVRDRGLRVRRAYWYAWASTYSPTSCSGMQPSFQYVGLVQVPCRGSIFTPTPLLSTYARVARRYEGCRKSDNARRCRR